MIAEAPRFPTACVATPHYLATATGSSVLAGGGNAVDAAVAACVTLAVVAPYTCGVGGDCFALVWDGALHAYNGSGRAPAAATPEAMRAAAGIGALPGTMPARGPLTVTVPGAVDAWFALLSRFGTRSFSELARPALRYAVGGFPLTARGAAAIGASKEIAVTGSGWEAVYGTATAGHRLRQPELARTLEAVCANGPEGFYQGPVASAVAAHVQELGGVLSADDLAVHHGDWVTPLSAAYHGVEVVELPPNSQGSAALLALNLVQAQGTPPPGDGAREHLLVEALKRALVARDAHLTDPAHMRIAADALADPAWAAANSGVFGSEAAMPVPGRPLGGGTAALCAVDPAGMCVSLIASNYTGFGSGITVPGYGVNLQSRAAGFSLDPTHVNVVAPGKRTLHTLMPAMALREGRPWCVFGTMGGDGQAQTHVQLLVRCIDDGDDVAVAVAAPRWFLDPSDWRLHIESRSSTEVLEALRRRGHDVHPAPPWDSRMGHAQAVVVTPEGLAGAADPRAEGAVAGF